MSYQQDLAAKTTDELKLMGWDLQEVINRYNVLLQAVRQELAKRTVVTKPDSSPDSSPMK